MFNMFVIVDEHQHFKHFISQSTSIRLECLSSNAEKPFVSNLKIADYFFKLGYDVSAVWWQECAEGDELDDGPEHQSRGGSNQ